MGRNRGRPRTGDTALTRERILEAALQLIDEAGVGALSMRRLAQQLGVDAMAIYHHLPGKDAVLAGVLERVFNELELPPARGAGWQEQVRGFARAYRELVRSHPHLTLYLVSHLQAGGQALLRANELLYSALLSAGLAARRVVQAADLVVDYLHGFALAEGLSLQHAQDAQPGLHGLLQQAEAAQFPVLRQVLGSQGDAAPPASLEAGLDLILRGIEATLAEQGR